MTIDEILANEERLQLTYDKGERYFEDKLAVDATIDDLDMELVKEYVKRIKYTKTPLEFLKQNNGFAVEHNGELQVSTAAILLFGKDPQKFLPRARVRFIRYEGTKEKFGTEMNVIKDVIFKGTILKMIRDSIAYLDTQIKEKTYLGAMGTFVTEEEYPKFVRQEIIVNAVTHRAYSITGTDIQIKMFDNRIVVESPGKLPGMVRAENIRFTHFSRNPKIAEFLKAYDFVKEYGEGVDRMCRELEAAGQKKPEYYSNAFMLQTVIYNNENPAIWDENPAIRDENPAIRDENPAIQGENPAIRDENPAIQGENPAIRDENPAIQGENPAIRDENPAIQGENPAIEKEKLETEKFYEAIAKEKYFAQTKENLLKIYHSIEGNKIFGAPEIKEILGCTHTASKDMMKKLRAMGVVEKVTGKGKGKYRFVC